MNRRRWTNALLIMAVLIFGLWITLYERPRSAQAALAPVSIQGKRFYSSGQPYFPQAEFLTTNRGTNLNSTFGYFSEQITDADRQSILNSAVNEGSNSIYLGLLMEGDLGGKYMTPYQCPSSPCNQVVMSGAFDDAKIQWWRSEMIKMINIGLRPTLWLLTDDSPTVNGATTTELKRYIQRMVQAFDDLPIMWVLALEANEYMTKTKSDDLGSYLASLTNQPIGLHQTPNRTDYMTSTWVDYGLLQHNFGGTWQDVYNEFFPKNTLGKPLIDAEYEYVGTIESQRMGLAAAFAGAAGVGDGAPAGLAQFMANLPNNMTPSRSGNILTLTGSGVTATADMSTLVFKVVSGTPLAMPTPSPGPTPIFTPAPTLTPTPPTNATITLDAAKVYQTMGHDFDDDGVYNGMWESNYWAGNSWHPDFKYYSDQLFDMAIDITNIDRVRLTINSGAEHNVDNFQIYLDAGGPLSPTDPANQQWKAVRYATVNDDNDPFNINGNGFHFSDLDDKIDNFIIPLRNKLQSRGRDLYINLNYIAFPTAYDYHHTRNPEEYAEFILAAYLHMQSKYGFVPDSVEAILEPENVRTCSWNSTTGCIAGGTSWPAMTPEYIADMIVAAGKRLAANGFTPRFSAPSNVSAANTASWVDRMVARNAQVLNYLTEISYHTYNGSNTQQNRQGIADSGKEYGLPTAQLEDLDAKTIDLHQDLKYGNNSSWQKYTFTNYFQLNGTGPGMTVSLRSDTYEIAQYMKSIRAGSRRIEAATQNSAFDPIAYINPDGTYTVIVKASAGGSLSIGGLPTGTYTVNYSTGSQFDVDRADVTAGSNGVLSASLPSAGVFTFAQKSAAPTATPKPSPSITPTPLVSPSPTASPTPVPITATITTGARQYQARPGETVSIPVNVTVKGPATAVTALINLAIFGIKSLALDMSNFMIAFE